MEEKNRNMETAITEEITYLVYQLQESEYEKARHYAVLSLGASRTEEALPHLLRTLHNDTNGTVRAMSANVLGNRGDKRAIPALFQAFVSDSEVAVQVNAIQSLSKLGAVETLPFIFDRLREAPVPGLLAALPVFLAYMGAPALPYLLQTLRTDEFEEFRSCSATTLGSIRDIGALPDLLHSFRYDAALRVRVSSVRALGKLNDTSILQELRDTLETSIEPSIHAAIFYSLGALRDVNSLSDMLNALMNEDAMVRYEATRALELVGSRALTPQLQHIYQNHANPETRSCAIVLMGVLGDESVLADVVECLELGATPQMRQCAAYSLKKLGAKNYIAHLQRAAERETDPDAKYHIGKVLNSALSSVTSVTA